MDKLDPSGKRKETGSTRFRFPIKPIAFQILTIMIPLAAFAQTPSFECAAGKSAIERAICSDSSLAALDAKLQGAYQATLNAMPAEARPAIRAGQRDWLGYRDECVQPSNTEGVDKCLTSRLETRIRTFADATGANKTAAEVQSITSFIPEHPDVAARLLRQYPNNPLGQAWLAWLAPHYPASGVTKSEQRAAQQRAEVAVDPIDHYDEAWSEYNDKATPRPKAIYYLLRLLLRESPDPGLVTCAHAFLFRDDWRTASAAFGGLNGSHRDDGAPYCEPMNGLFWLPAWRTMDAAFSKPINLALAGAGSMSSGVLANMKVDAVYMTIAPQSYGTTENIAKIDKSVQLLKHWHDQPAWSLSDRNKAIASIPATISETKTWAMHHYGLSPEEAQRAAQGIVGTYLSSWIAFIRDPEDGE